jgi:hypothetical protein
MLVKNKFIKIVYILLMILVSNTCHAGLVQLFSSKDGLKLDLKFHFNSWVIKEENFSSLIQLAAEMKSQQWANYRFVIEGHTDSQGSSKYNQFLSQQRANEVKNYLIKQGIDPYRLVAKGYGEDRLIDKSNTEQAHSINRRVMLNVLGQVNKKNHGDTRILVFANLIDADRRIKLNLSQAISNFNNLYKKVQVKEVISVTNEDCTRIQIFNYLKKDENAVNIIFFIGDIITGSDNELYFKTVDTNNNIVEYSALKLSDVIKILNKDSYIVLPRPFSIPNRNINPSIKIVAPLQGKISYNKQIYFLNKANIIFEKQYINASYGEYIGAAMKEIDNIYRK